MKKEKYELRDIIKDTLDNLYGILPMILAILIFAQTFGSITDIYDRNIMLMLLLIIIDRNRPRRWIKRTIRTEHIVRRDNNEKR